MQKQIEKPILSIQDIVFHNFKQQCCHVYGTCSVAGGRNIYSILNILESLWLSSVSIAYSIDTIVFSLVLVWVQQLDLCSS